MSLEDAGRAGTCALDLSHIDVFRSLDLRGLPRPLALAVAVNVLKETERGALLCVLLANATGEEEFAAVPGCSPMLDLVTRESGRDGHLHILRRRLA